MPHFTLKHGSANPGFGSPWLISSAFWFNFLRYAGQGMTPVSELATRSGYSTARVSSAVAGLTRWGYVLHHQDPNDSRPKPPKRDWVVTPTTNGKRWHEAFPEVIADIETAWTDRHGAQEMSGLRAALSVAVESDGARSAPFLPVLDSEHRTPIVEPEPEPEPLGIASLMSRAILSQVHVIEPALPLAVSLAANVARVADGPGVLVRDLPRRSGVAKQEATTMTNYLVRHGFAVTEVDPKAKNAKRLHLTDAGTSAASASERAVAHWDPHDLRRSLEALQLDIGELYTNGGWRSKVTVPDTLPHYPVVTGRGGYPDGS